MALKFGKVANNAETETRDYAPAIQMGIEHAPTKLIVKYITDMYARPLDAALRETVSNALDAVMVVGKDADSVKIDLDQHTGKFSVKDAGLGMTYDKLVYVYTQYGVSDKRNDGGSTGAFGLGAKSPLAYTNELTVITKTDEDGCLFLRAYRTSDDDFIADLPKKVDGTVEVTYYRDWQGNIMAPVLDADGNPCAPENGFEHIEEITDPFADGETGTVVSFTVNAAHIDRAANIIEQMSQMMFLCGDGNVTGKDYSNLPEYFHFGSKTIADDDGDEITMSVFAFMRGKGKTCDLHMRKLSDIFNMMKITENNIGFKVGNWIYPADGAIWSVDYTPVLIVDVPSKALPFVPSRDALRRSPTHQDNASVLVKETKKLVSDFCSVSENMEELVNWAADVRGDFAQGFSALCPLGVAADLDSSGKIALYTELVGSPMDNNTLSGVCLDPSRLRGFGEWSLKELMDTPNIVAGSIDTPYATTRNAGVYAVSNCDMSKILNGRGRIINRCETVCLHLPGYAVAKRKTVADGVTSSSVPWTGARIELASRIEEDSSMKVCNSAYAPTAGYPVGLAFMNLVTEKKRQPVILVDASECGVRKARMDILDMMRNSEEAQKWHSCTYFLIPPTDDGKKQKEEVVAGIRRMLEYLVLQHNIKMVFIPADKVPEMSRKNGAEKMKSSELEKMLSNCRVITHTVEYDEDGMMLKDVVETSYHKVNKSACAAAMNADPTKWGIVVAKDSHSDSLGVSDKYARALLALDMVPSYIEKIVCMTERNFSAARADMCISAGAMVLFDESGKAPDASYYNADTMRIESTGRFLAHSKIIVRTPPTEAYQAVRDYNAAHDNDNSFTFLFNEGFGFRWGSGLSVEQFTPKLIEVITCGHEMLPKFEQSEIYDILPRWKKQSCDNIIVEWEADSSDSDFASAYAQAVEKAKSSFEQCAKLWGWCLSNVCLSLKPGDVNEASLHKLTQIADVLGVTSCIDSLYAGVPIEDIMA